MAVWRTTIQTDYPGTGGPGYSTFHYRDDADGGLEAALQAATDRLIAAYTLVRPVVPATVRMGTEGLWVEVDGDRFVDVDGSSVTGSLAQPGELLPPATTLVVSWGTASNSRSGRGRTFLSGFTTLSNAAGVPTTAALTAVRAMGSNLVSFNETVGNGAFVVYSPTQQISRDITRSKVDPQWKVLRSRRD